MACPDGFYTKPAEDNQPKLTVIDGGRKEPYTKPVMDDEPYELEPVKFPWKKLILEHLLMWMMMIWVGGLAAVLFFSW